MVRIPMPEGGQVKRMFARIAERYDLANTLLSLGACKRWTRKLVDLVATSYPFVVADLATGSGDVAFALREKLPPDVKIRGYDFCGEMLAVAQKRKNGNPKYESLEFVFGDCMRLPIANESVDAVTIAYGIRNFEDRPRGLREIHRVLKPNGKAFILEFTQPFLLFRPFYYLYLKLILPILARMITGDKNAYKYLTSSISAFPPKEEISRELSEAGFTSINAISLTFSIVAIHVAQKPIA